MNYILSEFDGIKTDLTFIKSNVSILHTFPANRLRNFKILVTDTRPRTGHKLSGVRLCTYHRGVVGKGATKKLTCRGVVAGRYVAVQQARSQPLTLCEVRVFGTKGNA
jgi:hypothetical protein